MTDPIKYLYRWVFTVMSMAIAMSATAQDLKVGAPAPDFELAGSDGQKYSLSAFKGKQAVALAFFPEAFTGG
jgi:peroxiredoxin Q/BCP